MKARFKTGITKIWTLAALGRLLLPIEEGTFGASANNSNAVPPGSLILRGPMATTTTKEASSRDPQAPGSASANKAASPEHDFGLQAERAIQTNGFSFLAEAFDVDAFYRRVVADLPTSDRVKQQIQASPQNPILRKRLFQNVLSDIPDHRTRFLGVRRFGTEFGLLFRHLDHRGVSSYAGYVTERRPGGRVELVDVLRFSTGELMSQTQRREVLLSLAEKRLISAPVKATDQPLLSAVEAWQFFVNRCQYGKFDLIKQAYDQLPLELKSDLAALALYAISGEKTINDLMVPIERWRQQYPGDPCPELMVVDFYWRLYEGPREVKSASGSRVEINASWTREEEDQVTAAVERCNVWFEDAALEIRLARYVGSGRPEKARLLLQQSLKRFPFEQLAFQELLKIDLATKHFGGVAGTLQLQEETLHTNLTAMVNETAAYAEFRKSFAWKKWQHDQHSVDAKTLAAPAAPRQSAKQP